MINIKDGDINNRGYGTPVIEVDACVPSETAEEAAPVGTARATLAFILLVLGILAFILDVFY
ncbi:hypothetical protein KsCSTR_07780 [Candidatus Kuenenia stuttgartiensis]|jgi:hypothetical protein|uniref:Uncharacterized protein n=1 Tax=Kuenenia stuttgartiensis TaxID=174633 RepID=Q1PZF4_KUEST|nr:MULTISPECIES: hypothetical protein [Kuenenia]MBE7546734.1 hypothetical protein [Planctomycetia bacterium]MBW7940847.1 hypothetical protein [Candidatus Kuenenia stuttgartiensis]MBZ0190236.1 hypothetical protein [Candidatus Kuenenia stuttgartiensis]MCF6150985.1 hypothetical protein [Candidatus Kuenenia stuttgartiensis]MCL4725868.1 hypothetical protein [Candidatus Kuenenia stuttgartiensis]